MDRLVRVGALLAIWTYFILIQSDLLEFAGSRMGAHVRPVMVYAAICGLAVATALAVVVRLGEQRIVNSTRGARIYLLSFYALVCVIGFAYRGEGLGPEFGMPVLPPSAQPSAASYAVWPILNLLMAASLFVLVRFLGVWRNILIAAFVVLCAQVATMAVDFVVPGTFGQLNGRPGGLSQNANAAALACAMTSALLLPTFRATPWPRAATIALTMSVPAVLASFSRGGIAAMLVVVLLAIWAQMAIGLPSPRRVAKVAAIAVIVLIPLGLASPMVRAVSPTLWATAPAGRLGPQASMPAQDVKSAAQLQIEERARNAFVLDDVSTRERRKAFSDYFQIALAHPFGIGTGYSNKFFIGPHNMLLKLWVDNGFVSVGLFLVMLLSLAWTGLRKKSPMLLGVTAVAWAGSMLTHTALADPQLFVIATCALSAVLSATPLAAESTTSNVAHV